METVYLLLGTNLGHREAHLHTCLKRLGGLGTIQAISSIYETKAWGKTDEPDYLNQALAIITSGSPKDFIYQTQAIEIDMGRVRHQKWGTRIIDIDILFFGNRIIVSPKLQVPHPSLPLRRFALTALEEIAPEIIHPVLNKSVRSLMNECTDSLEVRKFLI